MLDTSGEKINPNRRKMDQLPWEARVEGLVAEIKSLRQIIERQTEQIAALQLDQDTGAYRKDICREMIQPKLEVAARNGRSVTFFISDIDNFKAEQDKRSHYWGDQAIAMVLAGLQSCVRKDDDVFRFGGDEGVVVCVGIEKEEDAENLRSRLEKCLDGIEIKEADKVGKIKLTVGKATAKKATFNDLYEMADADLNKRKAEKKIAR